jgi:hypothetical protein
MISTSQNLPLTHQLTLLTNLLIQIQPKSFEPPIEIQIYNFNTIGITYFDKRNSLLSYL